MATRKLPGTFRGGLELAVTAFADRGPAVAPALVTMPRSATLRFLLVHPITGVAATATVAAGDKVLTGQPLTRTDDPEHLPLIASATGTVVQVDQPRSGVIASNSACIVLTVDASSQEQRYQHSDQHEDDVVRLRNAGIRGLGGAAYSAAEKWLSARDNLHTLIINAAECEPLISCDEALIHSAAEELIIAIDWLADRLNCKQCLVGIEIDKADAVCALTSALARQRRPRVTLVPVPAKFPTGGERQLIKVLTGVEVPYGKHPADIGVLCFNLATTLAIKQNLCDQRPFCSRIVTVAGSAITTPANVNACFGTPVDSLIQFVEPDLPAQVQLTLGGPVSGISLPPDTTLVVNASTNCILVDHPRQAAKPTACIRCGKCDDVCPQALLPQQLHWYCRSHNDADTARFHLDACIECGCCDLVCPSHIPLTEQFRITKRRQAQQHSAAHLAERAKTRFDNRECRLQRREQQRVEKLSRRKADVDTQSKAGRKDVVAAILARTGKRKTPGPVSGSRGSSTDDPAS